MLGDSRRILIVGTSGRALACAARRSGYRPLVVDGFGDLDTREVAERCVRIPLMGQGLQPEALVAAVDAISASGDGLGLTFGAGFEGDVEVLRRLAVGRTVYGNCPQSMHTLGDPVAFFALLQRLQVVHPRVRFDPPRCSEDWLVKRCGGSGGGHVRPWGGGAPAAGSYWQRRIAGEAMSALFLADGVSFRVVGISTQRTEGSLSNAPYTYGGAISHAPLSAAHRGLVESYIDRIVPELQLRGLNSLDFVLGRSGPVVLEVNPRPGATFELYDADYAEGLFHWHLRGCEGQLPSRIPAAQQVHRGHAVVYATRAARASDFGGWPAWTADRPPRGTYLAAGEPVCSVFATGSTQAVVAALLIRRRSWVLSRIGEATQVRMTYERLETDGRCSPGSEVSSALIRDHIL